jgi:hypothetical protein
MAGDEVAAGDGALRAPRADHLPQAHPPVQAGKTTETRLPQGRQQVCEVDVAAAIPLARERQHSLRSDVEATVDTAGEVDTQDWVVRVRDR